MLKKDVLLKLMQCFLFMSLIVALFTVPIYTDQIATTKDGNKVILKDDGTWKKATPGDLKAINNSDKSKSNQQSTSTDQKQGSTDQKQGLTDQPQHISSEDITSLVNALESDKSSDFRSVSWGMTLAEVKKAEKLRFLSGDKKTLNYKYVLIGMNCQVIYKFKENKLVSAKYKIEQKHFDPALFNEDFEALKKYLIQVKGLPVSDQDIWKNEIYKSDKSKWGFAASIGFLTRFSIWKGKGTKINLQMNGGNHKTYIDIKYSSLKLS